MAVSVRQSTWKMVGANTKRRFRKLQIPEKHTLRFQQSFHAEAPETHHTPASVLLRSHLIYFAWERFLAEPVRVARSPEFA